MFTLKSGLPSHPSIFFCPAGYFFSLFLSPKSGLASGSPDVTCELKVKVKERVKFIYESASGHQTGGPEAVLCRLGGDPGSGGQEELGPGLVHAEREQEEEAQQESEEEAEEKEQR